MFSADIGTSPDGRAPAACYDPTALARCGGVDAVGDEMKHTDRAAGAGLPRVPPSLARQCAVLTVGGAIVLAELGARWFEDARSLVARQLDTLTGYVEHARNRILGGSEPDA